MTSQRTAGILLPVSSLPGPYGIGGFTAEAYRWIDCLAEAGQSFWQILPMGPTGYGDSPYQSSSTFAGNPYLIGLDDLIRRGFLTEDECRETVRGQDPRYVDYENLYRTRFALLKKAYVRFFAGAPEEDLDAFGRFAAANRQWLADFALYEVIKNAEKGLPWTKWDDRYKFRDPEALAKIREERADEYWLSCFVQYLFADQWSRLKAYAEEKEIRIIGDIPIYVSMDSADAWSHPELFQFDGNRIPAGVAGCPPDEFSPTGQLWGNPLYDWEYHRKTGYRWWKDRLSHAMGQVDVLRVDHFRGFEAYYSIPYGDSTAEFGHWEDGPGLDFFDAVCAGSGEMPLIAEDLGFLTDSVREMVRETGYPGMKVLHFAFDAGPDNEYLPHRLENNSVIYTGTHDNETTRGWYASADKKTRAFLHEYLFDRADKDESEIADALIRTAMRSVCNTCIIPMQDYLNLGNEARINHPATLGGLNWRWRMLSDECTPALMKRIRDLTRMYQRN